MIEGRKMMMETIEVFAWSFTARPIMLAILSDTAIKIARLMKYIPGFSGISASKTILAAEVKEEDFFCHVTHKTWDAILHDIRKAHEHDIDSTPDYSLAKKMALEIRKAIQSSGDYLGKVWAVIFNMLGIDFYKLPPDEQKILKRILSKAPNIKNSPFNFRRKRK